HQRTRAALQPGHRPNRGSRERRAERRRDLRRGNHSTLLRPMKFGLGLITCQQYPGDSRTASELLDEALEVAIEAERLGFDSVWVSEHHFVSDGYLSSLLPVCAAIAARTSR